MPKPPIKRKCASAACRKAFVSINKYCSEPCETAGRREARNKRWTRTCTHCGKTFLSKRAPHCSKQCGLDAVAAERRVNMVEPPHVPGCRWIPLSSGNFVLIDEADYAMISRFNWWEKDVKQGYAETRINGKNVKMHQLIGGFLCDHKSRNTYDNRRENLRPSNKLLNSYNRKKRVDKRSSPFVGVYPTKDGRWMAKITADRVEHYLGRFDTAEEAAHARDEAAKKLHGEFARLTTVEDGPSAPPSGPTIH